MYISQHRHNPQQYFTLFVSHSLGATGHSSREEMVCSGHNSQGHANNFKICFIFPGHRSVLDHITQFVNSFEEQNDIQQQENVRVDCSVWHGHHLAYQSMTYYLSSDAGHTFCN
jgi:hypothetical protein